MSLQPSPFAQKAIGTNDDGKQDHLRRHAFASEAPLIQSSPFITPANYQKTGMEESRLGAPLSSLSTQSKQNIFDSPSMNHSPTSRNHSVTSSLYSPPTNSSRSSQTSTNYPSSPLDQHRSEIRPSSRQTTTVLKRTIINKDSDRVHHAQPPTTHASHQAFNESGRHSPIGHNSIASSLANSHETEAYQPRKSHEERNSKFKEDQPFASRLADNIQKSPFHHNQYSGHHRSQVSRTGLATQGNIYSEHNYPIHNFPGEPVRDRYHSDKQMTSRYEYQRHEEEIQRSPMQNAPGGSHPQHSFESWTSDALTEQHQVFSKDIGTLFNHSGSELFDNSSDMYSPHHQHQSNGPSREQSNHSKAPHSFGMKPRDSPLNPNKIHNLTSALNNPQYNHSRLNSGKQNVIVSISRSASHDRMDEIQSNHLSAKHYSNYHSPGEYHYHSSSLTGNSYDISSRSDQTKNQNHLNIGSIRTEVNPETGLTTKRTVLSRKVVCKTDAKDVKVFTKDKNGKVISEQSMTRNEASTIKGVDRALQHDAADTGVDGVHVHNRKVRDSVVTPQDGEAHDRWKVWPPISPHPTRPIIDDDSNLGSWMFLDDEMKQKVYPNPSRPAEYFHDMKQTVDVYQAMEGFDTAIKELVAIIKHPNFKRSLHYSKVSHPGGIPSARPSLADLNCKFVTEDQREIMRPLGADYIEIDLSKERAVRNYSLPIRVAMECIEDNEPRQVHFAENEQSRSCSYENIDIWNPTDHLTAHSVDMSHPLLTIHSNSQEFRRKTTMSVFIHDRDSRSELSTSGNLSTESLLYDNDIA